MFRDIGGLIPDVSAATIGPTGWEAVIMLKSFNHLPQAGTETDTLIEPALYEITKTVCPGLNDRVYARHLGLRKDVKCFLFLKPHSAVTGARGSVIFPRNSKKMD